MTIFRTLLSLLLLSCSTTNVSYRATPLAPYQKASDHFSDAKKYMVTTQGQHASRAGLEMLEMGGNAMDAAAAVSFVISVERPQSTGIGGGGFLLYWDKSLKRPESYDFREKAPIKGHSKMFLDSDAKEIKRKSLDGIFAGGTPGLVAGIIQTHKKYGKLSLETVMRPAIDLANNGFKVYPELAKALKYRADVLGSFKASREIFYKNAKVMEEGDLLVQKDLAKTLSEISKKGEKGFYSGWVARAFVKEQKKRGGLIRMNDLEKYNVVKREPVSGTYNDYEVFSMGPPSSGGIHIIQILNIVEPLKLGSYGIQHPKTIHYTASAMQQAFADRARYLGDSDFVDVPIKELISKEYAQKIRNKIDSNIARSKEDVAPGEFEGYESPETTHFTIMDSEGQVVSSTQTINGYFGSGLVIPGTGIVLNNEMDDFATKVGAKNLFGAVGGENNLVEAQKRPLSSMSPTIVMKNGEPVLAIGTPSGTRILTCVAQSILNYIEHKEPLIGAVSAVRFHQQWFPDEIRVGEYGLLKDTEDKLREMGHKINHKNLGCRIQAIAKEGDRLIGVSDPRGEGVAVGD